MNLIKIRIKLNEINSDWLHRKPIPEVSYYKASEVLDHTAPGTKFEKESTLRLLAYHETNKNKLKKQSKQRRFSMASWRA